MGHHFCLRRKVQKAVLTGLMILAVRLSALAAPRNQMYILQYEATAVGNVERISQPF